MTRWHIWVTFSAASQQPPITHSTNSCPRTGNPSQFESLRITGFTSSLGNSPAQQGVHRALTNYLHDCQGSDFSTEFNGSSSLNHYLGVRHPGIKYVRNQIKIWILQLRYTGIQLSVAITPIELSYRWRNESGWGKGFPARPNGSQIDNANNSRHESANYCCWSIHFPNLDYRSKISSFSKH